MDLPSIVCYEGGPTFSGVSLFALSLSLRHRMQFQSSKAPETSGTERRLIMFLIQTSKQNCQNYGEKRGWGGSGAIYVFKESTQNKIISTFITVL